jgi:hypothetical protein
MLHPEMAAAEDWDGVSRQSQRILRRGRLVCGAIEKDEQV